jgi:hypothetical protein
VGRRRLSRRRADDPVDLRRRLRTSRPGSCRPGGLWLGPIWGGFEIARKSSLDRGVTRLMSGPTPRILIRPAKIRLCTTATRTRVEPRRWRCYACMDGSGRPFDALTAWPRRVGSDWARAGRPRFDLGAATRSK